MSHVKTFNLRFRTKRFAGDPDMIALPGATGEQCATAQYIDPRETPGFKKVEHLVSNFIASFPKGLKSATQGGVVDVHLLLAFLAPNVLVCYLMVSCVRLTVFSVQKSCCMIPMSI